MMGQANLFGHYWPEKLPAVQARYLGEVQRLFAILDARLDGRNFLASEYSIADIAHFCWVRTAGWTGVDMAPFPHLLRWRDAVAARPAVQRGLNVPDVSPVKDDGDNSAFIARTRRLLGLAPREA
jgi:glutathione S-transferase